MKRVIVRRVRANRPRATASGQQSGIRLLDIEILKKFDPSMLDLGDMNTPCEEKEAIAAVFDLTGFTSFCNQVDSYLAIPRYLNDFLEWFFQNIRERLTEEDYGNHCSVWVELPVLVKFLGDGLLLIWEAHRMTEAQICRLAATLYEICYAYRREFYPRMSMAVNKPPRILRCGVARGKVFGIGGGKDYVGHCINNASRLSHIRPLTFCFPHRGFQVREHMPVEYLNLFIPKYVSIRGVGDNELVWVAKREFEVLSEKDRGMFRDVEGMAA
jgi:class 3 adenylate cyclase